MSTTQSLFMPHGQCFLWEPGVLWLNVTSDVLITLAYYIISAALMYFLWKRKDVPFTWMFSLFGLFIFACGTTHAMHVWTVWHPDYWSEGFIKAATAVLSFSTGLLLIPLLPKAMALRSPLELEHVNARLGTALDERQQAIETLLRSEAALRRRTEELTKQRLQLRQLASQLSMTEERERRRLATELHDYLAQLLVVCCLKVSQAKTRLLERSDAFLDDLNKTLNDCLRYTRTLVSELCPTALYESGLISAVQQLTAQMKKHGLNVTVGTIGPQPALSADQAMVMYQGIRELLFNVLKHAKVDHANVSIQCKDPKNVQITVEDHGMGFDVLMMTEQSTQGFGLFNIRERIEALGGQFSLRSMPGSGTTATLLVPVAVEPTDRSTDYVEPVLTPPLTHDISNLIRVLLVDDHTMVRQGLRSILDSYLDVVVLGEACDGQEAVNAVGALRPNLVIMDINMPIMDGITATRLIRTRYPQITVIGLSVNSDVQNEAAMIEAGAALLLTKEAAVEQLYSVMKQAIKRPESTLLP
jgi:signal transduction histidine kinase/ActR/RegA family two-component response regulator